MADLPATANGEKAEQNESKTNHDKAWKHLKELVDGVQATRKIILKLNPEVSCF